MTRKPRAKEAGHHCKTGREFLCPLIFNPAFRRHAAGALARRSHSHTSSSARSEDASPYLFVRKILYVIGRGVCCA
jgi:hypothetical protein